MPTTNYAQTGGVAVGDYESMVGEDIDYANLAEHDDDPDLGDNAEEIQPQDAEFYRNLAETIPEPALQRLASDLLRKIEEDKSARSKRDEQYEEGIRRTGLGNDAPGGAEFQGASRVVHPMMTKACIDYQSRVISELMPATGPCKEMIIGTPDKEKEERAERVARHMSWQLTQQIKEARSVLEVTFSQVPLGGSQYVRLVWDHGQRRPRMDFVPIDKVYVPFGAADFYSASRRTYVETIDRTELRKRTEAGMYRDLDLSDPSDEPEESKTEKANRKVEGLDDPGMNLDGDREVMETTTSIEVGDDWDLDIEEPGGFYPYLISIDKSSRKVLAIYRDWERDDEALEPIEHLFEFPFIPWRGAYSIGFPQIIGGLSAAATGALRALMDSAHANNASTGFVLTGSGVSGQTRTPAIGELVEINAGLEADDIRKRILMAPFNQPSPVLFQLLGFCVDAGEGVVRTSLDNTPEAQGNSNVPVGTQLSRVEQGLKVFGAVFGRAHAAFNRLLEGLYRLNRLYLPDEVREDIEGGEVFVRRSDYDGACIVKPVSDPSVYSEQQGLARIQAIQQRAALLPQVYDIRKVEERFLQRIKESDWESLLVENAEPEEMNAVNENLAMTQGKPVKVFPEQNHMAHLQSHLAFMASPILGGNPILAPVYLPQALKHISGHAIYYYVKETMDVVHRAAQQDPKELVTNDPAIKALFDQLLAAASAHSIPAVSAALQPAAPIVQQAMQMMQSLAPKPPIDPALAAVQAAAAETQRKAAVDQQTGQLQIAQHQADQAQAQHDNAMEAAALEMKRYNAQLTAETKLKTTQENNETALRIAMARLMNDGPSNFTDGGSLVGR